ncbi:MAG TPA: efflux RND transporter periplasmic adaptor subunit [Bryobacteraceae bacterium]
MRKFLFVFIVVFAVHAAATDLGSHPAPRRVRATGTVRAVRSMLIQVPRIEGQGGNLTLATLVENGAKVPTGELIASFDSTDQFRLLLEAQAKFDDLRHQVDQKRAEHNSNGEKRVSDLLSAEADLKKAQIEIRKGPILSEIDRQKNQVKLADAQEHVASLNRSSKLHDQAEEAEIRILELQRDRQQVAVDRQKSNLDKLSVKSPINGMVALENVWRNNSLGHAEEGDQLWPGQPLLRIFDPSEMEVELAVGEPDGAVLKPGARAVVHLDAFPDLTLTAHFESASPVATSPLGTSVKTFTARFRLDRDDPHLLPDLSVALDIEEPAK